MPIWPWRSRSRSPGFKQVWDFYVIKIWFKFEGKIPDDTDDEDSDYGSKTTCLPPPPVEGGGDMSGKPQRYTCFVSEVDPINIFSSSVGILFEISCSIEILRSMTIIFSREEAHKTDMLCNKKLIRVMAFAISCRIEMLTVKLKNLQEIRKSIKRDHNLVKWGETHAVLIRSNGFWDRPIPSHRKILQTDRLTGGCSWSLHVCPVFGGYKYSPYPNL